MRAVLLLSLLAGTACGKKQEAPAPVATPAPTAGDASAVVVTDAGRAAIAPAAPTATIEGEGLEAIESIAAFCQGGQCNPRSKGQGTPPPPAPPFQAVKILNRGEDAIEDTGYLFIQTSKGWFVHQFLWSLEEGELHHEVKSMEVRDFFPGGTPELVVHLDRTYLDGEDGPVMQRQQEVLILCAVDPAGTPSCIDPREPIVVASRAEDVTWRVDITPGPDGTIERTASSGKPPDDAVGTVSIDLTP